MQEASIPAEEVRRLVDLAVRRDAAAFGLLYDLYVDPIYRYVFYRVGNAAEAEDLTETVFLKAWESIHKFRWQGRPFLAWLYRLAHNVVVDHLRAQRHGAALEEHGRSIATDQDAELERRLFSLEVSRAMRRLTEEQQHVIVLKFVEGLDNSEIAALMGKKEGAVRALQLRALIALRKALQEEGS